MLKDRKEGVICLHWLALSLIASAVYLCWVAVARAFPGLFPGVDRAYISINLLGIVVASCWLHRILNTVSHRLGDMDLLEAWQHSRHQILRFITVLFTIAFVMKHDEASRLFLVGYIIILMLLLPFANVYIPRIIAGLFFRGMQMRTVVAVKSDEVADLCEMMALRTHLGIKIVGWVGEGEPGPCARELPPRLGSLDELHRILPEFNVTQVVISLHSMLPEQGRVIAQRAEEAGCRVRFFSHAQRDFPEQLITVEHEGPFTFVSLTNEPLENPVNRLLKRVLDIAVSLPMVVLVLPPLALLVRLIQWRQSPGPVLFSQLRSGHNRKKFLIYKFRTMHVAGNGDDALQARKGDSRVYPFGRFLRRSSLDEFPQFFNVLLGHMSVSGPRPHLLEHDERFAKIVNTYYIRHFVKPGITGLAQCRGFRGEILEPSLLRQRIDSDMFYIRRWTLLLDLQILLWTAYRVVFPHPAAY